MEKFYRELKGVLIDYPQNEIIFIDDGSDDKSNKIIRDFEPSLIFHLAAESHVDRSIVNPFSFFRMQRGAHCLHQLFINNIIF